MASASYASRSLAMSSLNPTLLKWLVACRLANVSPGNVTTGTPIHKASQVVIPPEYGNVSSAMSIDRYPVSISSPVDFPTNSKRSSSMEYSRNTFRMRATIQLQSYPLYWSLYRDLGSPRRIRAQECKTCRFALAGWFMLPKVTYRFCNMGVGVIPTESVGGGKQTYPSGIRRTCSE